MTSKPRRGYEPLLAVVSAHDVVVSAPTTTRQHALGHADARVDLIVTQGTDAGGHTGVVVDDGVPPKVVALTVYSPLGQALDYRHLSNRK